MPPVVSIVTPCYNGARFVGETIASVRGQTLGDWEHVIVDDGSTDGSADVATAAAGGDGRVRVVRKTNGGVSAARNTGFREADPATRYLLFLDADDVLEPDMLATLCGHLDAHPGAGFAYCLPAVVDAAGAPLGGEAERAAWARRERLGWAGLRAIARDDPVTPLGTVYSPAPIIPSVAVLRRSVYARTAGFDEAFGQGCEDTDVFVHMALMAEAHRVPRELVRYRRFGGQWSGDPAAAHRQERKLRAKWRSPTFVAPEHRAAARRMAVAYDRWVVPLRKWHDGVAHLRHGRAWAGARVWVNGVRQFAESFGK